MKASLYHTFRVPCRVKICQDNKQKPYIMRPKNQYELAEGVVARVDSEGAILITSNHATPPIFVDSELANALRNNGNNITKMPDISCELLLKSHIIKEGGSKIGFQQIITVKQPGLPFWGAVEVTSKCNCNCLFCYHKSDLDGFTPKLSDVIARIDKMLTLGIIFFEITGGEALLRKYLVKIIEYLNKRRVHYILVTNGEYLRNATNDLLDALRFSHGVLISIDGIGSRHDIVRRRPGLYSRILQGLERLKQSGVKIFFNSTLYAGNIEDAPGMVQLARQYNTSIQLRPVIQTMAIKGSSLETAPFTSALNKILQSANVHSAFALSTGNMPPAHFYGCNIIKNISVDVRGRLFPCIMDRSRQLGNLVSMSLDEYAEAIRQEQQRFRNGNKICNDCYYKNAGMCGGFCRFSKTYRGSNQDIV